MSKTIDRKTIDETFEKVSNWGRWGPEDQIGTLNHITAEDIIAAAGLVRRGKVFALGLPLDSKGPQRGLFGGRWNPIHLMLATGSDAVAAKNNENDILSYADDAINMPIQCGTHWDSLGHIFYNDKMYNGYDAAIVNSQNRVEKNGIEHTKDRMIGRGVLLDIARFKGVDYLPDGYGITNDDLDKTAEAQGVEIRKGDFVILRTGQMEQRLATQEWGDFAGGDAPGVEFENCFWCYEKEIAAICSDTWGVEVRPNRTTGINQPWHWLVIPAIGITMGEMFYLKDIAEYCASEKVYEFFFCAPPLNITGGTGSPINPQAVF